MGHELGQTHGNVNFKMYPSAQKQSGDDYFAPITFTLLSLYPSNTVPRKHVSQQWSTFFSAVPCQGHSHMVPLT